MSFINLAAEMSNVAELKILPAGTSTELIITDVYCGNNKADQFFIMPKFEILGNGDDVKEFSIYLLLPQEGLSPKDKIEAIRKLSNFGKAFDIDFTSDVFAEADGSTFKEELIMKRGWAILGAQVNKKSGEEENTVKKFEYQG